MLAVNSVNFGETVLNVRAGVWKYLCECSFQAGGWGEFAWLAEGPKLKAQVLALLLGG